MKSLPTLFLSLLFVATVFVFSRINNVYALTISAPAGARIDTTTALLQNYLLNETMRQGVKDAIDGMYERQQRQLAAATEVINGYFHDVFNREPDAGETRYWLKRWRYDDSLKTDSDLINKMRYYKSKKKTMGLYADVLVMEQKATAPVSSSQIGPIFKEVYGRDATTSEKKYWLNRLAKDKDQTSPEIKDKMLYHKVNNIKH